MSYERTIHVSGFPVTVALRPKSKADPTLRADFTLPISGKRKRYTTGTTKQTEAIRQLETLLPAITAEIRKDIASSAPDLRSRGGEDADPRISDLANWYTGTHLPFMGVKPVTLEKARHILREFELWASFHNIGRVSQLNMGKIQEYAQWAANQALKAQEDRKEHGRAPKPRSPKTTHNHIAQLRSWLLAAVDAGKLDTSPVRKWLLPRLPEREVTVLSRVEVLALVEAVRDHQPDYYAPVALAAHTGMRIADIIDLRASQVSQDRISRPQNKTTSKVTIPITKDIRAALTANAVPDGGKANTAGPASYVFLHPRLKTPFRKNALLRAVQTAATKAELGFRPTIKILRASWATHLAESGCPPKVLMELMGHKNFETTLKFYVRAGFEAAVTFLNKLENT